MRTKGWVILGVLSVLLSADDLSGQQTTAPRFGVEIGAEWPNTTGSRGPGGTFGVLYRPGQTRWQLTTSYSWLGSSEQHSQVPHPTAGMLAITTESSDRAGAAGVRFETLARKAGTTRIALSLGAGLAMRHVSSIVTATDSTGAFFSESDNRVTLWGPRGELLGSFSWNIGGHFQLGITGGPTLILGAGAGEDGEVGAGALTTWVLRGQIGF